MGRPVYIDIEPLQVHAPVGVDDNWKEWVYLHCKDELLQAMSIRSADRDEVTKQTGSSQTSENDNSTSCSTEEMSADEMGLVGSSSTTASSTILSSNDAETTMQSQPEPKTRTEAASPKHSVQNVLENQDNNDNNRREQSRRLQLLDMIARVQNQLRSCEDPTTVFNCLLDSLLELTESVIGFIGEVKYRVKGDPSTMYLQIYAISSMAWDAASRAFFAAHHQHHLLRFSNLDTLFGQCMVTRKPVISNDPSNDPRGTGVPVGHPRLNSFMALPFLNKNGEMKGMVGIANKSGGYSPEDVEFLEPFTATCANLIQVYWTMKQHEILINTLEDKVKERTAALLEANRQLEAANRRVVAASAAQLQHFACMSHEIRTPLNCIIGLSSVLIAETSLSPMQRDSIQMIVKSGDLLLTVVNDVLDYSKLETGHVEIEVKPTSLQDILSAVVHSIDLKASSRLLTLRTFYDVLVPEFMVTDGQRLQQILYNLLGNAVKFSHEGGVVELAVTIHDTNDVATHETKDAVMITEPDDNEEDLRKEQFGDQELLSSTLDKSKKLGMVGTANDDVRNDGTAKSLPTASLTNPVCSPPDGNSMPHYQATLARQMGQGGIANQANEWQRSGLNEIAARKVIQFVVKDYGRGINRKDFHRIFEPFRQASSETERLYGGTGLGLAITSRLVTALGGTISVDSEEGEWSEFTVSLPFYDIAQPQYQTTGIQKVSEDLASATILFIDEEQSKTAIIRDIFEQYRVSYMTFTSMEEMETRLICTENALSRDVVYVCLIQEDSFDEETYEVLTNLAHSILLTFGPHYSMSSLRNSSLDGLEEDSIVPSGHFRSLVQILPSVLMQSICRIVNESRQGGGHSHRMVRSSSSGHLVVNVPCHYRDFNVLIAEDNVINQKVLIKMLHRLGIKNVDVVDNGLKAVEQERRKRYEVVLMDKQMPIMDGVEACRQIVERRVRRQEQGEDAEPRYILGDEEDEKQNARTPEVIFVTAQVSASCEAECKRAGCSAFLTKPFNIDAIEQCFQKLQQRLFQD